METPTVVRLRSEVGSLRRVSEAYIVTLREEAYRVLHADWAGPCSPSRQVHARRVLHSTGIALVRKEAALALEEVRSC